MPTMIRHPLSAMLLVLAAPSAAQTTYQDMAAIDAVVEQRLGAAIGAPGGAVRGADRRLRLRPCATAPLVAAPANGSVMVTCPSAGWRLFVPVDAGGDAQRGVSVVAAAQDTAAQDAAPSSPNSPAIRRGERVRVAFRGAGFSIIVNAQALTASTNGRLRVRTDRGAIWDARVDGEGRIIVDALN